MPLKDLTFAVMLSKAPSEYVKATPQHIKAVRQLEGTRTIKMVGQEAAPTYRIASYVKVIGKMRVRRCTAQASPSGRQEWTRSIAH